MINNKYISLVLILSITFIASVIGGFTTATFKEPWYSQIILPNFNPPSWVFAPVWTILYIFMSLAIWLAYTQSRKIKLVKIYFIHLIFNSSWSVIFFGFHEIFLALVNILIIYLFVLILTKEYLRINLYSFYLMIPYLLWLSYALILNLSIFILN
tara:strand:- start:2951 stop:3415 length:465 start_codon:yes stop_codon:yes gene_type:complete